MSDMISVIKKREKMEKELKRVAPEKRELLRKKGEEEFRREMRSALQEVEAGLRKQRLTRSRRKSINR